LRCISSRHSSTQPTTHLADQEAVALIKSHAGWLWSPGCCCPPGGRTTPCSVHFCANRGGDEHTGLQRA
jgi:hypothetical protein